MPRLSLLFRLNASASFSSCAQVFGTLTSFVLTTSPMFSICVGTPYSFPPYENDRNTHAGNCFLTVLLKKSCWTRPSAASAPVVSCGASTTSGAVADCTVDKLCVGGNGLTTISTEAPVFAAQALATFVTDAFRSWSV